MATAKVYEFPTQINGMYTEAYIEEQYRLFYEEEELYQNEQKKLSLIGKIVKKILLKIS